MKRIVTFGNCQAGQLSRILCELLPPSNYQIFNFFNNERTGKKRPNSEILSAIHACDVLIYQPLSISHNELSEESLMNSTKNACIHVSFPYIFNSGVYSLCHAPWVNAHKYGKIFGEAVIIKLINLGMNKYEICHEFKEGNIDFNIVNRFKDSLAIMKKRELSTDIKLTKFIENKYKDEKLFITHNHPSNLLFYEVIRQLISIVPLPIKYLTNYNCKCQNLPETNCPITPYDIITHEYKFDAHTDWFAKGVSLIELICEQYLVSNKS